MREFVYVSLFIVYCSLCFGQSDTINRTDSNGLKQGYWQEKSIPQCSGCISNLSEGNYKDDKKEGTWIFNSSYLIEITQYHKGLKNGSMVRKYVENNKEGKDTIVHNRNTYSNDTLIESNSYAKIEQGGYMNGKFLSLRYYLNPQKDTLTLLGYKPDSSQKLLLKHIITNFSLHDYFEKAEHCIPPLPSYCLQKSYGEEYFEIKGMYRNSDNPIATKGIFKIDGEKNLYEHKIYDSLGVILSEEYRTGPVEVSYHDDGDSILSLYYYYSNGNRITLHQRCSKEYPSKNYRTYYSNGKITSKSMAINYGKDGAFDTSIVFYDDGKRRQIKISTNTNEYDTLFYPSGKIKYHLTIQKGEKNYMSYEVSYYEIGGIRKKSDYKEGNTTRIFFFENGRINYYYTNNWKRKVEKRQLFNSKGQLVCSFKKNNKKIKWIIYDEKGEKTIMKPQTKEAGEGLVYIGCEFEDK